MTGSAFAKRYELADGAPAPWTWAEYSAYLASEWPSILDGANSEKPVQNFLEANPCLLPGGEGGDRSAGGHHGPFPSAVVREPELPGLTRPRPDFLWITKTSAAIHPVLIEIEDPRKKWFTHAGGTHHKLTQARSQIASWKSWLDSPAQQQLFQEKYVLDDYRRSLPLAPRFVLAYGRRAEVTSNAAANGTRLHQAAAGVDEMTYDRLTPQPTASNCVTATAKTDGWHVTHIPPTFQLGPENAADLVRLFGWESAIRNNQLISTERRDFLLTRLSYWRKYHTEQRGGVRAVGDRE